MTTTTTTATTKLMYIKRVNDLRVKRGNVPTRVYSASAEYVRCRWWTARQNPPWTPIPAKILSVVSSSSSSSHGAKV